MKWEHILLVILIGVLVYLWITWPKPKPDERILEYEKVISDHLVIIDSLSQVLDAENAVLNNLREEADSTTSAFQNIIARHKQQLHENEKIHSLPTPELDSIVRSLYGEGAI